MCVVVDPRVDETVKVVKAALKREKASMHSQIPLPKYPADITSFLQHCRQQNLPDIHTPDSFPGNRIFRCRVLIPVIRSFITNHVVKAVALWITAGEKGAPAGGTCRPGHIKTGQSGSLPGDPVEIGSDQLLIGDSEIVISLVIGDDQDDIRRLLSQGGRQCEPESKN